MSTNGFNLYNSAPIIVNKLNKNKKTIDLMPTNLVRTKLELSKVVLLIQSVVFRKPIQINKSNVINLTQSTGLVV